MKKQNTPEIYQGLVSDPKNLRRCLVEDLNMTYSLFDSRAQLEGLQSYESLIKPTIQKCWNDFNDFTEKCNKNTSLLYHEQLFGATAPKKQDLITTQLYVWHKLCSIVKNNLCDQSATPKDPVTQRKSNILNCNYYPGETQGTGEIRTFQAIQCIKLFRACLGERESVSEGELKQYVIDHAGELKTKQEPWRIFQYYRPSLIAAKIMRRQ